MKYFIGSLLLLLVSFEARAATTVTVDDSNRVQVSQTVSPSSPTQEIPGVVVLDNSAVFEGEIEKIDRQTRTLDVMDTEGRTRRVLVTQETADAYRTGDFVQIHPITGAREVTFIREENDRDLEGRIVQVDSSQNTISVRDAQGRDRRVKLKQGMIGTYKVDDYVRIHLMADLKEAKMIRTIQ